MTIKTLNKPISLKEKKVSKKKLDKELLLEWRNNAIKKYGNACEYCGKTSYLNVHHVYSRADRQLRYDLDNACVLCSGCHTLSSKFSAHLTPMEFSEWIREKRGEVWYRDLQRKHWQR